MNLRNYDEKTHMCRIFGFRSVINSQVHKSLVEADNALEQQSVSHPDGWGLSYYINGAPHIIKSSSSALNNELFKKVSGVVSSQTVIAHVRKATLGSKEFLNTHPFQFGNWTFAHNGNIKSFDNVKEALLSRIKANYRRFILGDTDSEVIFYFLLSFMDRKMELHKTDYPIAFLLQVLRDAIEELILITGEYSQIDQAGEHETYLTFIISNGSVMIAHQGGKKLYYSTYKNRCSDRDFCSSFSNECEAPSRSGLVNHLIFSSEPLSGENIWLTMGLGDLIGVDSAMKIHLNRR